MLTESQTKAFELMRQGHNCFLTGTGAGVGKSYLLCEFIAYAKSKGKCVIVTASTGIAASNIGGMTCHSSLKLGLAKEDKGLLLQKAIKNSRTKKMWNKAEILIIEEISMLNTEFFEKYSYVISGLRGNMKQPFGGIQVILCGDYLQLPGIGNKQYIFECDTYKNLKVKNLCLYEIVRQTDKTFIDLLSKVRVGEIDPDSYGLLKDRQIKHNIDGILKLYPINKDVDSYNDQMLNAIDEEEHVFNAILSCTGCIDQKTKEYNYEALVKDVVARKRIVLKRGCKVIFLKNDQSRKLVNGSRGTVVDFSKLGFPIVKFGDKEHEVGRHEWTRETPDGIFAFCQIPLLVAYSITVHKSQSLTFEESEIDLGQNVFESGMAYVALSRMKTLEGLYVSNLSLKAFKTDEKALKFHAELKSDI